MTARTALKWFTLIYGGILVLLLVTGLVLRLVAP